MSDDLTAKQDNFQSWFMDKLLMGMSWPEYLRSLMTPFNILAALILSIGLPLIWGERRLKILVPFVLVFPATVIMLFSYVLGVYFDPGVLGVKFP